MIRLRRTQPGPVVCQKSNAGSSGGPVGEVEQSAQPLAHGASELTVRAPPLAELYDLLRAEGFAIGVDDHVRIGRLLACDATWTVELLRTAVRALVMTDADAREAFDSCWERWTSGIGSLSAAITEAAVSGDTRSAGGSAVRLPEGRAGGIRDVAHPEPPGAMQMRDSDSSVVGEAKLSRTKMPHAPRRAPRLAIARIVAGIGVVAVVVVLVLVSRSGIGGGTSGTGSGKLPAGPGSPLQPPLIATHDAVNQPAGAGLGSAPPPLAQGGFDGKQPGVGAEGSPPGFTSLAVALGGIALAVVAISSLLAARRRRRFVPGPWHYMLAVPAAARPVLSRSAIEDAAADLTWRVASAGREFDVAQSVVATVERGGLPTLVYRRHAAAPRYLVLEDTAGGAERWQAIYDELFAGLAREGVAIERYRFVANPEHCMRPDGQAVPLSELIDHADALIVIGDGDAAIDPIDGRCAGWLALLHHVPRRLWINPVPPIRWSAGAHAIAEDTTMEHGVARVIAALHAGFDRRARPARPYPAVIERAPETASAVAALRVALGEPTFHLVSAMAMAVPPTLAAARWLAEVLALELNEQDWLAVATLHWFRAEVWPEGLRDRLRSALEVDAPELASAVAEMAADRHAASEPPRGSVAHLAWELDGADRMARQGERAAADRSLRRIAATPLADAERQLRAKLRLPDHVRWAHSWAFVVGISLTIAGTAYHIEGVAALDPPNMIRFQAADVYLGVFAALSDDCRQLPIDENCAEWRHPEGVPVTHIAAFELDRKEATNDDFSAWLNAHIDDWSPEADGVVTDRRSGLPLLTTTACTGGLSISLGRRAEPLANAAQRPVTCVTWYGAEMYCRAQNKRLPLEAEWEFAAKGTTGRPFPWGTDANLLDGVAYHLSTPRAVGTSAKDVSPEGVYDLAGNVAEWVQSERNTPDKRVVRGGSFLSDDPCRLLGSTCARISTKNVGANIGFRCARSFNETSPTQEQTQ